jgi:hypothetical protein
MVLKYCMVYYVEGLVQKSPLGGYQCLPSHLLLQYIQSGPCNFVVACGQAKRSEEELVSAEKEDHITTQLLRVLH